MCMTYAKQTWITHCTNERCINIFKHLHIHIYICISQVNNVCNVVYFPLRSKTRKRWSSFTRNMFHPSSITGKTRFSPTLRLGARMFHARGPWKEDIGPRGHLSTLILLMEEIRRSPVDMENLPLFTRFIYPRWCRISSINSIIWEMNIDREYCEILQIPCNSIDNFLHLQINS